MNRAGAVNVNAPLAFAVVEAICVHGPVNGKSSFSRATGVEPAPETVPFIVRPLPQTGRMVVGVTATPVGALPVVNVRLAPRVMPAALVATARKLYLVFGFRSAIAAVTDSVDVPEPIPSSGVEVPYAVDVPYSKCTDVNSPRGLTPAFSTAPTAEMLVAEREEIAGADAGVEVLNVRSE